MGRANWERDGEPCGEPGVFLAAFALAAPGLEVSHSHMFIEYFLGTWHRAKVLHLDYPSSSSAQPGGG